MNAVATLFWQSFAGTRLARAMTVIGIVLLVAGCAMQLVYPNWQLGGNALYTDLSLFAQAMVQMLPWLAILTLFLATSAQPRVVRGLVFGHARASLPNVRRKVLLGVVAVAAAVSLATAVPAALSFYDYPIEVDVAGVFRRTFLVAFINFGLLYVAFLALAYLRGILFFVGPTLILVAISVPLNFLIAPASIVDWRILSGIVGWLAYGGLILAGDRIAAIRPHWRRGAERQGGAPTGAEAAGVIPTPEPAVAAALLLGADRPWIIALGQCLPAVLALWLSPDRGFVLFGIVLMSLVIFAALNGARSVFAGPRSRALWLRTDSTIAGLFGRAEHAYLRQAVLSLAVASALLIAIGLITDFSALAVTIGLALLVLATAAGLYLGLSMTRGLPLGDALLAAVSMGLVVTTTVLMIRGDIGRNFLVAGGLSLAMTAGLRFLARARWSSIDWLRCRLPDRS